MKDENDGWNERERSMLKENDSTRSTGALADFGVPMPSMENGRLATAFPRLTAVRPERNAADDGQIKKNSSIRRLL